MLLSGKSRFQIKAYAEDPDIEILSNSSLVQAVRDNRANVTGYVFWYNQAEEIRMGDVNAVEGFVTIAKDFETHTMTLGMSDVYQKNNNLQFRVYGDGPEEKPGQDTVSGQQNRSAQRPGTVAFRCGFQYCGQRQRDSPDFRRFPLGGASRRSVVQRYGVYRAVPVVQKAHT